MASITVEVETTRDIARQFLRHRSFAFQKSSQRYADPTQSLSFVLREARLQDATNRQNSIEIDNANLHAAWNDAQQRVINLARQTFWCRQSPNPTTKHYYQGNKMKVRLVGYTQPAKEFIEEFSSCKDLIAFCAKVSNPDNQYNFKTVS